MTSATQIAVSSIRLDRILRQQREVAERCEWSTANREH